MSSHFKKRAPATRDTYLGPPQRRWRFGIAYRTIAVVAFLVSTLSTLVIGNVAQAINYGPDELAGDRAPFPNLTGKLGLSLAETPLNIYWDNFHDTEGDDNPSGIYSTLGLELTNAGHSITEKNVQITASELSGFDVLILIDPENSFSSSEISDIQTWVDEGHGLFVVGEMPSSFNVSSINDLLTPYGIQFTSYMVTGNVTSFNTHPVTAGVNNLRMSGSGVLEGGTELGYSSTDRLVLSAYEATGKVVVFADASTIKDGYIGSFDEITFVHNTIDWFAPPPIQGVLRFSAASYSVSEEGVKATITVIRTNGSDGVVCVDYATFDETATAGSDYVATSGPLCWGDEDVGDKTFDIDIIDDTDVEDSETLGVSLTNATGGATIGFPDTAVLTIIDVERLVVLAVEPAVIDAYLGQMFEVRVEVRADVQSVEAASAYLDFDPTYLQVESMLPGNSLSLVIQNQFDNELGEIDFAAGILTTPYPSGTFDLVTIQMTALAATPVGGTLLSFAFDGLRQTDALLGSDSVFNHAEDGTVNILNMARVNGHVNLQRDNAAPAPAWVTDLRVSLTVQPETVPRYNFVRSTNDNGDFELGMVEPGMYDMRVKSSHSLQNMIPVDLSVGENMVNAGELLEGDANDDNCVSIVDFNILANSFGKCVGDPGFDEGADFNQTNCVSIVDFNMLAVNFGQCGAPAPN